MTPNKVFLGGTTAGPSWRALLTPKLVCPYFNPIVKDWNDEAQAREKEAKEDCGIALYVLTPYLKSVFSVAEIVEDCVTRRPGRVIVCVLDGFQGKVFEPHVRRAVDAVLEMVAKYEPIVVNDLDSCASMINSMSGQPCTEVYLHKNPFLSLKKMYGPMGEYIFSHEERCGGHIVAVLPYRNTPQGQVFLARSEFTPPWGVNRNFVSSITGGVDDGEGMAEAASRELKEEAGFSMDPACMISLGTVQGTKSVDTVYHLFTADVTECPGDGNVSKAEDAKESLATNIWVSSNLEGAEDPLLFSLMHRWSTLRAGTSNVYVGFQW